jgi:hypothetical protein
MAQRKGKPATFKVDTEAYLTSIGARPWPNGLYAYVLDTIIGALWITPYDDWIACRWKDVEKARAVVDCNPCSGKWNFHGHLTTAAATLAYFQAELSRFVLPAA